MTVKELAMLSWSCFLVDLNMRKSLKQVETTTLAKTSIERHWLSFTESFRIIWELSAKADRSLSWRWKSSSSLSLLPWSPQSHELKCLVLDFCLYKSTFVCSADTFIMVLYLYLSVVSQDKLVIASPIFCTLIHE